MARVLKTNLIPAWAKRPARGTDTWALTPEQYLAALTVVGRLWEARGNPAPMPEGPMRQAWQTAPFTLSGDLLPACFGYCACKDCA